MAESYSAHFQESDAARKYETGEYAAGTYSDLLWHIEQDQLRAIISDLRRVKPRIEALDFASGTGRITAFIEDEVDAVTGIEISQAMVESVGAPQGFGHPKGAVGRLANGFARESGKMSEPAADGGGAGGDANEPKAKPPVWRRGVATGNGGQVGTEQLFPRPLAARSDEGKRCMNGESAHVPVSFSPVPFSG
ncbi:MAG: class I SAM-dependent methyltransferase [Tepidisphaeraceae bacterium]